MTGIDLTKILNKMTVENYTSSDKTHVASTTDFVKIKSWDEIKRNNHVDRKKSLTDFAILNNAYQNLNKKNGRNTGQYYIRSFCEEFYENHINLIDYDGGLTSTIFYNVSSVGVCPSLEINISKYLSLSKEERDSIQIKHVKKYKKERHFLEMGEYPKNAVSEKLGNLLEELFNYGFLQEGLTCTGKLYPNIINSNLTKQNPEFEYQGKKYVRVASFNTQSPITSLSNGSMVKEQGKTHWLEVEPIKFEIKNWDNLPNEINPNSNGENLSDVIELEADDIVFSGASYYPNRQHLNSYLWQNSLLRAFLNSADSKDLDGDPLLQSPTKFNYSNSGFLKQAFDLTREPTLEFTVPKNEDKIVKNAFRGCVGLKRIIINENVKEIGEDAFSECPNVQLVFNNIYDRLLLIDNSIDWNNFNYIYLSKSEYTTILSPHIDQELEKSCIRQDCVWDNIKNIRNKNYIRNVAKISVWKEEGKVKFMPPEYTLLTFPESEIDKYFVNNNNRRWGNLVKTLAFDTLQGTEKTNSLTDLMKIYYAIGGFSDNQGESEKAYDYIIKYVARLTDNRPAPYSMGQFFHSKFSKLELKGPYNKTFAQFFMKYYKDDSDFMRFGLPSNDYFAQDYLCQAHNNFDRILKLYPNRVVNGNEERALLTPKFVAEHSMIVEYENVENGNELLAETIGKYGYSQSNFEYIQEIYDQAKNIKNKVIQSGKSDEKYPVKFRILEKDDPLGFVIGDITNCCQHINGQAESCVIDGYKNPNAGFLVFEENILDENGKPTEDTRILAQAYVWYDPETKTICYDNIEIPSKVLSELKNNNKHVGRALTSSALIEAVERSAESIMLTMNQNGVPVKRVTTGKGYNDLNNDLAQKFKLEQNPIAKLRNYSGYSDASSAQFIIKTYDNVTKAYGNVIKETISQAKSSINNLIETINQDNIEIE